MKWMPNSKEKASIYRFKGSRIKIDECGTNWEANRNVKLFTRLKFGGGAHFWECVSKYDVRGINEDAKECCSNCKRGWKGLFMEGDLCKCPLWQRWLINAFVRAFEIILEGK